MDTEMKISEEEKEWLDVIAHAYEHDNDKQSKPNIAMLCLENNVRPVLYDRNDDVVPYQYKDEDDRVIDKQEAYHDLTDVAHQIDEQMQEGNLRSSGSSYKYIKELWGFE